MMRRSFGLTSVAWRVLRLLPAGRLFVRSSIIVLGKASYKLLTIIDIFQKCLDVPCVFLLWYSMMFHHFLWPIRQSLQDLLLHAARFPYPTNFLTMSLGTPYISWGKPWFTLDFPFNQSSDNELPSCKKYRHAHTHTYTYIHNYIYIQTYIYINQSYQIT